MKTLLFLCTALLLGGCASLKNLPPISAESFNYSRHDTAGGTDIAATKLVYDSKTRTVKAESVTWTTIYPFISFSVSVKGYVQEPTPPATP
jgi:hypothetical protein